MIEVEGQVLDGGMLLLGSTEHCNPMSMFIYSKLVFFFSECMHGPINFVRNQFNEMYKYQSHESECQSVDYRHLIMLIQL